MFGIVEEVLSENLIKASEAAQRLGVSLVTAKRMIADGRLVGEKIGNRWQVDEHSIDHFLNKSATNVNAFASESDQVGAQELIETDEEKAIRSDQQLSDTVSSSLDDSFLEDDQSNYERARVHDDISFPVHKKNVREFGYLFGSIQLDPEQLFFECLRFVNDEIWIYWRQRFVYSYDDTLKFDHKYSVSVIDLLSLSLFDVLSWLINLLSLKSDFTVDDYQEGLWRFELRRESKDVSDDGEKLYARCAFSHPFEFQRRDSELDQEGGIYPLETTVTSVAPEQLEREKYGS